MNVGLDTSVVLRLLIGEPRDQAERAWRAIVELRSSGGRVVVSDLVASEAYFALQHHYGVSKAEALRHLKAFFESGEVIADGVVKRVLVTRGLGSAKPGFVDRMIHEGYLRNLDGILTFEKAAKHLPRTHVLGH